MSLSEIGKRLGKITADNSPAILTAIGVTGTVMTAVLTGRAAVKAEQIFQEDHAERVAFSEVDRTSEGWVFDIEGPNFKEKIILSWKLYVPAVGTGVMTIACIIFANRIGTRRAAGLAAAYSISERAFSEYKDKVIEKIGSKKEEEVRDELAQDRINRNPVKNTEIIITGVSDALCYDQLTGRYFRSSVPKIRAAENKINHQINNSYFAALSDFYDELGLNRTVMSDEIGWNADKLLEVEISATLTSDDEPCISLGYRTVPIRDYHRIH